MSGFENVITALEDFFDDHANDEGKIKIEDFREMLEENPEIAGKINPSRLENKLKKLDTDNDKMLDKDGFAKMVALIIKSYFCEKKGKGKRRGKKQK